MRRFIRRKPLRTEIDSLWDLVDMDPLDTIDQDDQVVRETHQQVEDRTRASHGWRIIGVDPAGSAKNSAIRPRRMAG